MKIESEIFKKSIPDYKKIIQYGFVEQKDRYVFEQTFFNGEFVAKVEILKNGKIIGKVYDFENKEEYLPLRLETPQGAFVNEVKTEYKKILKEICQNCFSKNLFIYPQTNRIASLILEKYNDAPVFMWEKFPGFGIFKNPNNGKWYGAIMNIDRSKFDRTKSGEIELINIKLDKSKIQELLTKDGFYQAWHMNKKSWITIALDETISDEDIMKYIEESHSFTVKKR